MIKFARLFLGACILSFMCYGSSFASEILSPLNLTIQPYASSGHQIAGVYWLPDYYKDKSVRSSVCEGGTCNTDPDYACESYDYETPGTRDMELYICDSKYPAGHAGGQCYANCRCQDKFQYTAANCKASEGKMGAGKNCEGKYAECVCQPANPPQTGEECALYCAFDNSCVKTRCKPKVTPGVGEECKERCDSDHSVCTQKGCKAAVDTNNPNDRCVEWCASDRSICTDKICTPSCTSDSSFPYGYDTISNNCGGTCKIAYGDNCRNRTSVSCGSLGCASYYFDCSSKCSSCNEPAPEPEPDPKPEPEPEPTPSCTYTTTASNCSSQCKNVGSQSCTKNGTTYYNGCGSSKCTGSQTCENGTCKNPAAEQTDKCEKGAMEITCTDTASKKVQVGTSTVSKKPCYECQTDPDADLTCKEWIAKNHTDFRISENTTSIISGAKVVVMNDVNTTLPISVPSGGFLVGPAYFDFAKCKTGAVPTIKITNQDYDGVTLNGGTVASLNLEYDPVNYMEGGSKESICYGYDFCLNSSNDNYMAASFYDNLRQFIAYNEQNFPRIISILSNQGCQNRSGGYDDCSVSYGSCNCTQVARYLCQDSDLRKKCHNNLHNALVGYGTLNNVTINKLSRNINNVVFANTADLRIEGTVNIFGADRTTPLRVGKNEDGIAYPERGKGTLTVNGTLNIKSGRGIYYTKGGKITVNQNGLLKIQYGAWEGIFFNYANMPMEVYGKLDISSFGSGGQFNNDLEFARDYSQTGVLHAKDGSCIKLSNGGSGSGVPRDKNGNYGTPGSGTFKYDSGSQLNIKGICKKAATSGNVTVTATSGEGKQGTFVSPPSGFSGSCTSCP